MNDLQRTIDEAWETRATLSAGDGAEATLREAVEHVIDELDAGRVRVAEKSNGAWIVRQWIKKAVLLSFRIDRQCADRPRPGRPCRSASTTRCRRKLRAVRRRRRSRSAGVRVVPPAVARRGAYIAQRTSC